MAVGKNARNHKQKSEPKWWRDEDQQTAFDVLKERLTKLLILGGGTLPIYSSTKNNIQHQHQVAGRSNSSTIDNRIDAFLTPSRCQLHENISE